MDGIKYEYDRSEGALSNTKRVERDVLEGLKVNDETMKFERELNEAE